MTLKNDLIVYIECVYTGVTLSDNTRSRGFNIR